MAVRPLDMTSHALVKTYTVAATKTVTKGMGVIFSGADDAIDVSGANGIAFGTALESGVAGDKVRVALHGYAIIPVLVGTGGATRGVHAIMAADGYTDKVFGTGATVYYAAGRFMQSGVATDYVGLLLGGYAAGAT